MTDYYQLSVQELIEEEKRVLGKGLPSQLNGALIEINGIVLGLPSYDSLFNSYFSAILATGSKKEIYRLHLCGKKRFFLPTLLPKKVEKTLSSAYEKSLPVVVRGVYRAKQPQFDQRDYVVVDEAELVGKRGQLSIAASLEGHISIMDAGKVSLK